MHNEGDLLVININEIKLRRSLSSRVTKENDLFLALANSAVVRVCKTKYIYNETNIAE